MRRLLPLLALTAVAATFLFWNLGGRYLWQDEAACALMAERMMESGKPLAHDGTNLITMDEFRPDRSPQEVQKHTGPAAQAVEFFRQNGDYKDDTTWIGQPWGQFVLAGLSLSLFGHGTVPARLPFVLAGVLTVVLLHAFVRKRLASPWMAWVASALLLGNVFWFLHVRQCRYYATATLLLLVTLGAYLRWREGKRFGAPLFVLSAWLWFQNDFGSPIPVLGVLFVDALLRDRKRWKGTLATFAALGLTLLPFVLYYELGGRLKESFYTWDHRLLALLFNANQYQLPLLLVPPIAFSIWKSKGLAPEQKRLLWLALAIPLAQYAWMTAVSPMGFYRYIVDCTPLCCLVIAFGFVRGAELVAPHALAPVLSGALAVVWLVTPWLSLPVTHLIPEDRWAYYDPGTWTRPELRALPHHLTDMELDPNRATVEFLEPRLREGDEIVVTYEDLPIAFYTGHPVRGGIPGFRLFDHEGRFPRFVVVRPHVNFIYIDLFQLVIQEGEKRGQWRQHVLDSHGVTWGNNPDPNGYDFLFWREGEMLPVTVYELIEG
jgi:hypothetical protein